MTMRTLLYLSALVATAIILALITQRFLGYSFKVALFVVVLAMMGEVLITQLFKTFDKGK